MPEDHRRHIGEPRNVLGIGGDLTQRAPRTDEFPGHLAEHAPKPPLQVQKAERRQRDEGDPVRAADVTRDRAAAAP